MDMIPARYDSPTIWIMNDHVTETDNINFSNGDYIFPGDVIIETTDNGTININNNVSIRLVFEC